MRPQHQIIHHSRLDLVNNYALLDPSLFPTMRSLITNLADTFSSFIYPVMFMIRSDKKANDISNWLDKLKKADDEHYQRLGSLLKDLEDVVGDKGWAQLRPIEDYGTEKILDDVITILTSNDTSFYTGSHNRNPRFGQSNMFGSGTNPQQNERTSNHGQNGHDSFFPVKKDMENTVPGKKYNTNQTRSPEIDITQKKLGPSDENTIRKDQNTITRDIPDPKTTAKQSNDELSKPLYRNTPQIDLLKPQNFIQPDQKSNNGIENQGLLPPRIPNQPQTKPNQRPSNSSSNIQNQTHTNLQNPNPANRPTQIPIKHLPSSRSHSLTPLLSPTKNSEIPKPVLIENSPLLSMLSNLRYKYSQALLVQLPVSFAPHSVAVSPSVSFLYYYGDGVGTLVNHPQGWRDQGRGKKGDIHAVKSNKKGKIIIIDSESLTVHSGYRGAEILVKNKEQYFDDFNRTVKTRCADDLNSVVWNMGKQTVGIVEMEKFQVQEVEGFWRINKDETSTPVAMAISSDSSVVFGLGTWVTQRERTEALLHTYRTEEDNVEVFKISDLLGSAVSPTCIDLSFENDTVFLAGGKSGSLESGFAFVAAISLKSSSLSCVAFQKWSKDTGYDKIVSLRRHADCNVLFLGTSRHVLILLYAGLQFYVLNQVTIPGQRPVTDVCQHGNTIWVANNTPSISMIHFDHDPTEKQLIPKYPASVVLEKMRREFNEKDPALLTEASMRNEELSLIPKTPASEAEKDSQTMRKMMSRLSPNNTKIYPKFAVLFQKFVHRSFSLPETESLAIQSVNGPNSSLWVGGSSLQVLKRSENKYLAGYGHVNQIHLVQLVSCGSKDGSVVVVEETSFDLVKYSSNFSEIQRIKGNRIIDLRNLLLIRP